MNAERNSQIIADMIAKIGLHPRVQSHKDRGMCISFRSGGTYRQRMRLCGNKATCGDYCKVHAPKDE